MLKICFILSSVGGPRLLSSLFLNNSRPDVSYLVFQHMPNEEFISALIQCLKSEISNKIEYVKQDVTINPGEIYFLSTQYAYNISDGKIVLKNGNSTSEDFSYPINCMLQSAAESDCACNVVVLSGMLLEQDGIQGIVKLKEKGAKVYTLPKKDVPIKNMIEDLESFDLIDEVYSTKAILANLDFSSRQPSDSTESLWLIVDDEEQVREVIGNILSLENIESDTAVDVLDALRKIQKSKYAAMILDIKMPELDGLQTLEALQTIDPEIPILIVTGFKDEQTQKAAEKPNVKGILLKPFTSGDVRSYMSEMKRT